MARVRNAGIFALLRMSKRKAEEQTEASPKRRKTEKEVKKGTSPGQPPGLKYKSDFITKDESLKLVEWVDGQNWLTDLARKTQHYGKPS